MPSARPLLLGLALLGVGAGASLAADPDPRDRLKAIQQETRDTQERVQALSRTAQQIAAEQERLRRAIQDAGRAMQAQEARVGAIEERLAAIATEHAEVAREFELRRDGLERSLRGLLVAARMPSGFATLVGTSPVDTQRAALLLGGATGTLEGEARQLRGTLDRLAALQSDAARQRETLAGATATLNRQREDLRARLAEREAALAGTEAARKAERERLAALAAEARDAKQLIEKLVAEEQRLAAERQRAEREAAERLAAERRAAERQQAAAERAAAERASAERAAAERAAADRAEAERERSQVALAVPPARIAPPVGEGGVILPARGRVVSRFGDQGERGLIEKGIKIATAAGAAVFAPTDGKVIFAGPFRGYGQLLILAHGEGYHLLIAGFGRIDANVGQSVSLGEPLGFMAEEAGPEPLLYVELRRKGEPVNPQSWLAQAERKVDG